MKAGELLDILRAVEPGLSALRSDDDLLDNQDDIEQSACFVFEKGTVTTYNDIDLLCRAPVPIAVTGSVKPKALLKHLDQFANKSMTVSESPKFIEFAFGAQSSGVRKCNGGQIFHEYDEVETPTQWRELPYPGQFAEALEMAQRCVAKDYKDRILAFIHIHPEHIESCNNLELMRVRLKTGFTEPVLILGTSLRRASVQNFDEFAVTENWVHFRNRAGLLYSCRKEPQKYPNLDHLIEFKGHLFQISKLLAAACERTTIFSSDRSGEPTVLIELRNGEIRMTGDGLSGWCEEWWETEYKGPDTEFLIFSDVLQRVCERYTLGVLNEKKLKFVGADWEHVVVLGRKREKEKLQEKEKTPPV